jgi:hypothetical protein
MYFSFLPFVLFWVLLFIGRSELGLKWITVCIGIWVGLWLGCAYLKCPRYVFVAGEVLLDVVLLIVVAGGNVRIR